MPPTQKILKSMLFGGLPTPKVKKMKFIKRRDVIFIGLTIILCLLVINIYRTNSKKGNVIAEIYYKDTLTKVIELSSKSPQEIILASAKNVRIIYDGQGQIYFKSSDCPDKVCVNAGKLSTPPQTAACLPNGVLIKIVSLNKDKNNEIDTITK